MPPRWPVDMTVLVVFYVLLAATAACLAMMGPFDAGTRVTRADLGPAWPLTIFEGTLRCEVGGAIILQHHGTEYNLTRHDQHGAYADVAGIQAEDVAGNRKDLSPLIERGMRLCS